MRDKASSSHQVLLTATELCTDWSLFLHFCVNVCACAIHMWRSENNTCKSVLFPQWSPGYQTQIVRLGGRHIYLWTPSPAVLDFLIYFILGVWGFAGMYVCVSHVHSDCRGQRMVSDSLELELQMVVRWGLDARNGTLLWKCCKRSWPQRHHTHSLIIDLLLKDILSLQDIDQLQLQLRDFRQPRSGIG